MKKGGKALKEVKEIQAKMMKSQKPDDAILSEQIKSD
jgi:hypothetical protein